MEPEREQELLLHVAAGTDLLTALAALPPAKQAESQPEPMPAQIHLPCKTGRAKDTEHWMAPDVDTPLDEFRK